MVTWTRSQSSAGVLGSEEEDQSDCSGVAAVARTVRRIVRSGETVLTYERKEQPLPKLGPFVEQLDSCSRRTMGQAQAASG